MNQSPHGFPWQIIRTVVVVVILFAIAATSWRWRPELSNWFHQQIQSRKGLTQDSSHEHSSGESAHDHGEHSHNHEETSSLNLSPQARKSLGLTSQYVQPVQLQTYQRTITVPAVVVGRPGRTNIKVATPLTGVVEHAHAVTGEVVESGSLLFEIRLTHEDLVQTQTEFLKTLGELDVEEREIKRLSAVAESGAVAGKTLLERQYAKEKMEALLKAEREALRLHGLSDRQIEEIVQQRHLLRELKIMVPSPDVHDHNEEFQLTERGYQRVAHEESSSSSKGHATPPLVIEQLNVQKGQSVAAGEQLCVLADYSRLYIEGKAFEQDSLALSNALQKGWSLTAVFDEERGRYEEPGLKIAYIANSVDVGSRTLSFFVDLTNDIIRDETNSEGQRFISWKYRVGQRLEIDVPVEEWEDQLVVPVEAVAKEGAESYVFQENGDHFDRVPVHVRYRDQRSVVIANDGSIYPGDVIALRGAHQLLMALKNKAGGGVDPHAGHNH